MANCESRTRTNYFHVTDPDALTELLSRADAEIDLWPKFDKNGEPVFAFGCCDSINELDIDGLQALIQPCDACIISSIGYEKLNYVAADIWVVTCDKAEHLSLDDVAFAKARELLKNPVWTTDPDY